MSDSVNQARAFEVLTATRVGGSITFKACEQVRAP